MGEYLGPLFYAHTAVESDARVGPIPAKFLEEVESLSVVGNQNDLVVTSAFDHRQNTVEDAKLAGQFRLQFPID